MPQNSSSNKLSSIIGITLLIAVIAFTVFISFFDEEPIEEIEEEEAEIEEPQYRVLDSTDLANLWKLKNLQTDSFEINYNEERTFIEISELKTNSDFNLLRQSEIYDEFDDSTKQLIEMNYFEEEKMVYCGTLDFKNSDNESKINSFDDFKIRNVDDTIVKSLKLLDIGTIFLEYQIESIQTKPQIGDFTTIYLRDGREIFLIKENIMLNGKYYKERIESAEYFNDSTRIILPSN